MAQTKLNWYYVYSQRYEALHNMVKASITDPRFNVVPLFVDQSEFNKTTYAPGNTHFLSGCNIKQEVILEILKKAPTNSYFIFSDVDIAIIKQDTLFDYFQSHIESGVDLSYMWEHSDSVGSNGYTNYNIGISLIRANEKTIDFYTKVIEKGLTHPTMLDQNLVCSLLPEFQGKFEPFHKTVFCLSNFYPETEPKTNIMIVQLLCSNSSDYKRNMCEKYMGIKAAGIPIEKYLQEAIQNGRTPEELGVTVG